MSKRFEFRLVFILILILNVNLIISQQLSQEDQDNLYNQGYHFSAGDEFTVGDNTFKKTSGNGFIQYRENKQVISMRGTQLKTPFYQITTPNQGFLAIAQSNNVDLSNYDNSMKISGSGNTRTITINEHSFKVKSDPNNPPKFVLEDSKDENKKGHVELKEAEFEVTESSTIQIKNLKFQVPEGGKVLFKDGKVTITVPKGKQISESPEITDGNPSEIDIKYLADKNGIELKNGDNFDSIKAIDPGTGFGLQDFEIGYDTELNKWYLTRFVNYDGNLVGLIGNPEDPRIYLFSDGEQHPEFNHPYFSYKKDPNNNQNSQFSFGTPSGKEGVYFTFLEGNDLTNVNNKLIKLRAIGLGNSLLVPGKKFAGDSHMTYIPAKDNNPSIVKTRGSYQINNGQTFSLYEEGIGPPPQIVKNRNSDVSGLNHVPMAISSFDSNGKPIQYKLDDGRTATFNKAIFINERGDFSTKGGVEGTVLTDVNILNLNQNYRENLDELILSDPQKALSLMGQPPSQIRFVLDNLLPDSNANIQSRANLKRHDTQQILYKSGDYALGIHEGIHFLTAQLNGDHGKPGYEVKYLGDGKFALIKKTGIPMVMVGASVPRELLDGGFRSTMTTYFYTLDRNGNVIPDSLQGNRDSTQIIEETFAYQIDAKAGFQRARAGLRPGSNDGLSNSMDYNIINLAHLQQLEKLNNDYYKSPDGAQMRGVLKYSFEEGMRIVYDAYSDNRLSTFREEITINNEPSSVITRINNLRTHPRARELRQTAIDNYGSKWTQEVFGFSHPEGWKNQRYNP